MGKCFHCLGDHETSQCVKQAADRVTSRQKATTKAIEELGYRTLEQMRETGKDLLGGLDGIRSGLDGIRSGLDGVRLAIGGLLDFQIWAHAENRWLMEKQIHLLTGIHDMVQNPRATQANELYKMGVDSFKRHRLSDALKLLQEASELNPGDYRIHVTLGHIYVQIDDLSEALECFRSGVDYARTSIYKRDALLLQSRTLRCLGRIDQAINAAEEASLIDPAYPPAHYELASCMAERLKIASTTK